MQLYLYLYQNFKLFNKTKVKVLSFYFLLKFYCFIKNKNSKFVKIISYKSYNT